MGAAGYSRRDFLRAVGAVGAVGAVSGNSLVTPRGAAAAMPDGVLSADGRRAASMAMHLHASFSEGIGSMEAHLAQAAAIGVDVVWWSEHDHRMSAHGHRRAVHFDALTELEDGRPWTWSRQDSGSLTASAGGIVTAPVSPRDPSASPGAMRLSATSAGPAWSWRGYAGAAQNDLGRGSLAGQTLTIDVRPEALGKDAYLAVVLTTSWRPAREGVSAGQYVLSYRIGGSGTPGRRTRSDRTGIVTLAAPARAWTTLVLDPAADIAAIWPGAEGRDASLYQLSLRAVSRNGARAEGFFDILRFRRSAVAGDEPLRVQSELMAHYARAFPGVRQHQALEVSLVKPHLGWLGGAVSLPDHTGKPVTPDTSTAAAQAAVDAIHAAGGLASYNHPFGTGSSTPFAVDRQESLRRSVTTALLSNRALRCDVLEVGYRVRGGVTLGRHASVWDSCSRNAIFLTGTGVSDDHSGTDWLRQPANFLTWVWTPSLDEPDLLAALAAGRAFFGDPARFRGSLDLLVDGTAPMGSVTVSRATEHRLRVVATGIPIDGAVEIVRGVVDYAGPSHPDPVVSSTTVPATTFAAGSADVVVPSSTSCFVRAMVRDGAGVAVALSNPVWLLRDVPPGGIPRARAT